MFQHVCYNKTLPKFDLISEKTNTLKLISSHTVTLDLFDSSTADVHVLKTATDPICFYLYVGFDSISGERKNKTEIYKPGSASNFRFKLGLHWSMTSFLLFFN